MQSAQKASLIQQLTSNSQHYLLNLDFWIVDVDASAFFHQIFCNSDTCRLPTFTVTSYATELISDNSSYTNHTWFHHLTKSHLISSRNETFTYARIDAKAKIICYILKQKYNQRLTVTVIPICRQESCDVTFLILLLSVICFLNGIQWFMSFTTA